MRATLLLILLLPTASAEWQLFSDDTGELDALAGPDLLDARLIWDAQRPDIQLRYEPGSVQGTSIDVTWEAEDWFGDDVGRYGVRADLLAGNCRIIKGEGAQAEELYGLSCIATGTDPVTVTFSGLPLDMDFLGVAMKEIRGSVSMGVLAGGDTAAGTATHRFDKPLSYGAKVEQPAAKPLVGSWAAKHGNPSSSVSQLDDVYVTIENGTVSWIGKFAQISKNDIRDCKVWLGSTYLQDARPDRDSDHPLYWASLIQVNWLVEARGDVVTPARLEVHTDPRSPLQAPNVTVEVDSMGWVKVQLEEGWWVGGTNPDKLRVRFESECRDGDRNSFTRFSSNDSNNSFNFPAPSAAVLALMVALIAAKRRR